MTARPKDNVSEVSVAPMDNDTNVELNIRQLNDKLEEIRLKQKEIIPLLNRLAELHGIS